MIKCFKCEILKNECDFSFRNKKLGKFRNTCKECRRQQTRQNYYERKEIDPFTVRHQQTKQSAKQRGIEYNLTPEFLKQIWTGVCPISGKEIFFSSSIEEKGKPQSAELDRFDPNKGYIIGNVSWISREFNMKKQNNTIDDLKMLLNFISTYEPKKDVFEIDIKKRKQIAWNKNTKGYSTTPTCEDNPSSKLTKEQVLEIRKLYNGERGQLVQLSKKFKVSRAAIKKIVNNITWRDI